MIAPRWSLLRLTFIPLVALPLAGCPSEPPDDQSCPLGTERVGSVCVRPDGGPSNADGSAGDGTTGEDGAVGDAGGDDATTPDAGEGQASLSKTSLDFGRTLVGRSAVDSLEVRNDTSRAVIIRAGLISGGAAADYSVVASATVGASGLALAPGQRVSFTFTFAPRAVGARNAAFEVLLCEGGCSAQLTLSGEGLLDALECAPQLIDFGFVNPGACVEEPVTCSNVSSHDAALLGGSLVNSSSPAFSVSSTTGAVIAAGANLGVRVRYCPTGRVRDQGTLELTTDHPDAARRVKSIALDGTGGGPDLQCTPAVLDFGILATGQSRTRAVHCANIGDGILNISSAALQPAGGPWSYSGATTLSLSSGETRDLEIRYAPTAAGMDLASFEVDSDDRDTPVVQVMLLGEAVSPNGCAISVVPASLDFGGVLVGRSGGAAVAVSNSGTGACGLTVVGLAAGGSAAISLVNPPGSVSLNPGASASIALAFAPTAVGPASATLQLQTTDLLQTDISLLVSGSGIDASYPLTASPPSIDFGTLGVGCTNVATRELTIANTGNTALNVTVARDAATSADFRVGTGSTASALIAAHSQQTFIAGFSPSALGARSGALRVSAPGLPSTLVAVMGSGAAQPSNVQTFSGVQSTVVDLLLVVDDSGSMAEEQQRLSVAAASLLARADLSGSDYHIAVTTTDPTDPGPPATTAGVLRGSPNYVTPQLATRLADLQAAINQGVNGSAFEQGLNGAAEAVTNAGLLAGPNAGFLRPNAELAVLIISDEEDQSVSTVADYLSRMNGRPIGQGVRVFGITGGRLGCTGVGGFADAEQRYSDAADQTGGFVRSICDVDYAPILQDIADEIFRGTRALYQLGAQPAPGSVQVLVDGALTPAQTGTVTRWGIDYAAAQVVFTPGRAPTVNQTVEIHYQSVCIPATCGNGSQQVGEQCDDGNLNNTDACLDSCYSAFCGDGNTRANNEQCDDGNTLPGDGCGAGCVIEGCGNGIVEPPEACDNGAANSNTAPNACRTSCVLPACHDGVADSGEACDDGNLLDNDACVAQCVAARCGDGLVRTGVEQCDDGNTVNTDLCTNACTFNVASFTVSSTPNVPLAPVAGGTVLSFAPTADDGSATITLPAGFAFSFLGAPVTQVYVASNGYLSFENAALTVYTNTTIPDPVTPNAMIAWWWDDLNFSTTVPLPVARWQVLGTAPNRYLALTLENVPHYGTGGSAFLNAEVRLRETSGVIEVHYGTVSGTTGAWSATAGWESTGGVVGQSILGCADVCTLANWPTNTVYTYTP